jgi:hypothetical protein
VGLGLRDLSEPSFEKKKYALRTLEWSENGMIWANSGPTPICENIPNFLCSDCLNSKPVIGHVGMSRSWTCMKTEMKTALINSTARTMSFNAGFRVCSFASRRRTLIALTRSVSGAECRDTSGVFFPERFNTNPSPLARATKTRGTYRLAPRG